MPDRASRSSRIEPMGVTCGEPSGLHDAIAQCSDVRIARRTVVRAATRATSGSVIGTLPGR
ncbi:hypothetical protein AXK59_03275 [Tsukamurella tyrosinosolvens]|nr:hypothetical protein AXK59_03275 [Tsukamurella tyrosinosolvens]KZL98325.1 hypothetical protein AXX05_05425 [Tsukamurella tyrosinosolvens]